MGFTKVLFVSTLLVVGALARPESPLRLIQVSETETPKWLSQLEIESLILHGTKFMDITDHLNEEPFMTREAATGGYAIPTTFQFGAVVNSTIPKLTVSRVKDFLTIFTAFNNRHYNSVTGKASASFLFKEIQDSVTKSGYTGKVDVSFFNHSWAQPSIIVRIPGTNATMSNQIVVLGAHQDSIAGGPNSKAPGADDDGSGSAALLEALRAYLDAGVKPKRTLEFHWYAAEEVGLWGSQAIAAKYKKESKGVVTMMNLDVVGNPSTKKEIRLINDYTNPDLTQFLRTTISTYTSYKWINYKCGYGCSDHASWTKYGFRSAAPAEGTFSQYWHTAKDTMDRLNLDQIVEFSKIALGYAIEIAEPTL